MRDERRNEYILLPPLQYYFRDTTVKSPRFYTRLNRPILSLLCVLSNSYSLCPITSSRTRSLDHFPLIECARPFLALFSGSLALAAWHGLSKFTIHRKQGVRYSALHVAFRVHYAKLIDGPAGRRVNSRLLLLTRSLCVGVHVYARSIVSAEQGKQKSCPSRISSVVLQTATATPAVAICKTRPRFRSWLEFLFQREKRKKKKKKKKERISK